MIKVPLSYRPTRAGTLGIAFDYLVRAQIGRWTGDPWIENLPKAALRGLELLVFQYFRVYPLFWGISSIFHENYRVHDEIIELCSFEKEDAAKFFEQYQESISIWQAFIEGTAIPVEDVIYTVWLFAKLEAVYRTGWQPDNILLFLEPPSKDEICDLKKLWDVFNQQETFFRNSLQRIYNPEFGVASKLVGGADGDLYVDGWLIDVKTTKEKKYSWQDAAQIAAYYVLAAMAGEPWPIERLAFYKARYGVFEYVNVEQIHELPGFQNFIQQLLELCGQRLTIKELRILKKGLRERFRLIVTLKKSEPFNVSVNIRKIKGKNN